MKSLSLIIWLTFIALASVSCSKKGSKVDTDIVVTGFVGGTNFTGGLMIWGIGPTGQKVSIAMVDENDLQELLLDSGPWTFLATGWSGGSPLLGPTMCARTSTLLEGEDAVVNLSMNPTNCSDGEFASPEYLVGDQFAPIKLIVCDSVAGVTQGGNCDGAKGAAKSFRFIFNEMIEDNLVESGLVSTCFDEMGTPSTTTTTYGLPVGLLGDSPMNLTLETFEGLGCTGVVKSFRFTNGLLNNLLGDAVVFAGASQTEIFLESEVPGPSLSLYSTSPASYVVGAPIATNTLTVSGGTVTSFTITPTLPAGLAFSASTGDITGTPTALDPLTTYTITGTGPSGSDSVTLDLTVTDAPPTISGYAYPAETYTQGVTITTNTPTMTGGAATLFDIAPTLPAGLFLNTATGDITGTPTVASVNTTYTVTASNSGGSDTFNIDIEVQSPAVLTITDGPTYDFGTVVNGGQMTHTFTIQNTGSSTATGLTESGLAVPFSMLGGSFPGTGGTCTSSLAASGSCTIVVTFNPVSAIVFNDTIVIDYNDGVAAQTSTRDIQGTGANPAFLTISETDPYDYGPLSIGGSTPHIFTINNTGGFAATAISSSTLTIPYTYTGGAFPGTGGDCTTTLGAGATCSIEVAFAPTGTGTFPQTITINYNDGNGMQAANRNMTGQGQNPAVLTITEGPSHDFGIGDAYETIPNSDMGTWDANTNTPSLSDGSGVNGQFYRVTVAGSQNLGSGPQTFAVGDIVIYDGSSWRFAGEPPSVLLTINNTGGATATALAEVGMSAPFRFKDGTFPGTGGTCTAALANGSSCSVRIEYIPDQVGENNGLFDLSYYDGAITQNVTVNLNGKGGVVVEVVGSEKARCALFNNGKVKCWGDNEYGQLGLGDMDDRGDNPGEMGGGLPFVDLGTGVAAVKLTAGDDFFCALMRDEKVKCWGHNIYGQLGVSDSGDRGDAPGEMGNSLPYVDLGTGRTAKKIAAGGETTCALLDNDRVKCWGRNNLGQLGQGDTSDRGDGPGEMGDNLPFIDTGSPLNAKTVAVGDGHVCVILMNDEVKCWGNNNVGQLGYEDTIIRGDGPSEMGAPLPNVDLTGGFVSSKLALGPDHSCSLSNSGQVKCWGNNNNGQLGQESLLERGDDIGEMGANLATTNVSGSASQLMATANMEMCALVPSAIKCWGNGAYGGLGTGSATDVGIAPGQMGGSLPSVDLGTGLIPHQLAKGAPCAILNTRQVKCWGQNDAGQLGLGDANHRGDGPGEMGDSLPFVELH